MKYLPQISSKDLDNLILNAKKLIKKIKNAGIIP